MSTPEAISQLFQALADPTRVSLLRIVRMGSPTATDLHTALGMSQPRVARHLKILVEAGLLVGRREGRFVRYSLAASGTEARIVEAALAGLASGGSLSTRAPSPRVGEGKRPVGAATPDSPPAGRAGSATPFEPAGSTPHADADPADVGPAENEVPGGGMEDFLL